MKIWYGQTQGNHKHHIQMDPLSTDSYRDMENIYQINSTDFTCGTVNNKAMRTSATPIISSICSTRREQQKKCAIQCDINVKE